MKQIPLTQGKVALVDDEDYSRVLAYTWRCETDKYGKNYAMTGNQRGLFRTSLGAFILGDPPQGYQIDHKDGDSLNNQRENLRFATPTQNSCNRGPMSNNTTGYKGVCYCRNGRKYGYRVMIKADGKNHFKGFYETAEEAARVYNRWAKEYHGEFAYQNPV